MRDCRFCDFEQQMEEEKRRDIAEKMGDTLRHRGPDDFGSYAGLHTAFAHARLAVIDIEGGRQPMSRSVGGYTYTIVYNGELYNTPQLRRELTDLGYELSTRSDTEVLLCCYIHYREKCPRNSTGFSRLRWRTRNGTACFSAVTGWALNPFFIRCAAQALLSDRKLRPFCSIPG